MLLSALCSIAVLALAPFTSAELTPPGGGKSSTSTGIKIVKGVSTEGAGVATVAEFREAFNQGYRYADVRGYKEKWGNNPGGAVDPSFKRNVRNAQAAGFDSIGAFWFPCSGTTHNCKSYGQQIDELLGYINTHKLPISRIFLNIQIDTALSDNGNRAHNWDYGHAGNRAQAKEMVSALEKAGKVFYVGIQSSPGNWEKIFGSFGTTVDIGVPLWWISWDGKHSLRDLLLPQPAFGGWPAAMAKQYAEYSPSLSDKFQLNIIGLPATE